MYSNKGNEQTLDTELTGAEFSCISFQIEKAMDLIIYLLARLLKYTYTFNKCVFSNMLV